MNNWRLLACLLVWPCNLFAQTAQPIENFRLANGMEVVVLPNHRVAAVNHMIWYRVGAADDPIGKSGLAHYHEHMMFKGTERFKAGHYSSQLDKNGGAHNAFTGYDATSYHVTIAKDRLPLVMELEADRMRGLTVNEAEGAKERQVIIEERRSRIENRPEALFNEQMQAALFRNHPYHWPTIGWMHEMEGLTRQDVLDFHKRYYHPNNTVLVVSGDITAAELKPLAEKYYGSLKSAPLPPRVWREEPPHIAERRIVMHDVHVKQPSLTRVYAASSIDHGDTKQALPLYVLSYLLGGSNSSVLYQKLVVERKLASSVSVDYNCFSIGPAEFSFSLVPEDGVSLETLEAALDEELARFFAKGVDKKLLKRAQNVMRAEAVYAREGLSSLSHIVGWVMMVGMKADYINQWPDLISRTTSTEILDAGKKTLLKNASVTGYLLPEEAAK